MPASVTHALSMTTPFDALFENNAVDWNSAHAVTLDISATEISGLFSNANGVSFGLSGNSITASIAAGGAPGSISAGTTRFGLGEAIFSNANGISFGLDGATVTAQHNALTSQSNQALSGSNGSFTFQTATFGNLNGLSLYTSNGSIVGSYTVPSTAGLISAVNVSAGTTSNNLSAVTFSNNGNVSFGLNGSVVTATATVATSLSNIRVSGGTTSNLLSAITFADGNGVSFGLDGSTLTASHNGLTSQSNQNVTAANGGFAFQTLSFSNLNGISFGTSAGSAITASHNALTSQTNQQMTMFATGNTTQSSSGTSNASSLIFRGEGVASVGITGGSVVISVPAGGGGGFTGGMSTEGNTSGTTGLVSNQLVFVGGNNVTLSQSVNGQSATLTISAGAGGGVATASLYALGNTTQNSSTALAVTVLSYNALGAMTWGYSNGSIQVSAPNTSSLVGTNGISVSTNGSTISVMPQWISSYENMNNGLANSSALTWNAASISHAVAFNLFQPISASFARFPGLMTTNSTTIATMASATASASAQIVSTLNMVIYSLGVGGNSQSLQSVASGSGGATFSQRISITNSTQYSISQGVTMQAQGDTVTASTQYSISNTNYSFTTNQIATNFSSARFIDIPFANSLTPGAYWAVVGLSTSSASGGAAGLAAMTNCNVRYSAHYGASQAVLSMGVMGSTNRTSNLIGAASFSTAGGGTTNSLPISALSSMASNAKMYFQLIRSA